MIFADINLPPPSSAELYSWLICLAALMGIVLLALKIVEHFKEKPKQPQPFIVATQDQYTLKRDFDAHVKEAKERLEETNRRIEKMHDDAVAGRKNLHGHIEQIKTDLNSQVRDLTSEMGEIPERTINILLKTKGLI